MVELARASYVFLCGLVLCGLAGAVLELWARRPLAFSEPFVARAHIVRSLAVTSLCGPMMLANEAVHAYRVQRIGFPRLATSLVASCLWLWIGGTVVADVASMLAARQ